MVNNALFKNVTLLWFVCFRFIKAIRLSIIIRAHIIFTLALLHNIYYSIPSAIVLSLH